MVCVTLPVEVDGEAAEAAVTWSVLLSEACTKVFENIKLAKIASVTMFDTLEGIFGVRNC